MKYAISIYGCHSNSQAPETALRFCRALLDSGHNISLLFFYSNGVCCASDLLVIPQNDPDIKKAWKQFLDLNKINANVCIASALYRGIIDSSEAKRNSKKSHNLSQEYTLSGLGQLLESSTTADRFVAFGA